jgi:hypothetical protein
MQFLVNIGLDDNGGSLDREQNFAMITGFVLPSLEALIKHEQAGTVVGGPLTGSAKFVFIARAEGTVELERLLTALPVWPLMRVGVTPLVTFDERVSYIQHRLKQMTAPPVENRA